LPQGRTPTSGKTLPVEALTTNAVNFIWYDGEFNGLRKEVSYSATVNGVTGVSKAIFDVKKPTTSVTSVGGTTKVNNANAILYLGGVGVGDLGIDISRGVTVIPAGFAGNFQFVQVINATISRTAFPTPPNMPVITNIGGLDGCYPYTINQFSMNDSPLAGLAAPTFFLQNADYDAQFKVYLMFKPSGAASEWVPLKKLNWAWHGAANYIAGSSPPQWSANNISSPGSASGADTAEYPTWSNLVADPNGPCTTFALTGGSQ
jgi:hypothetical protein